MLKRILKIAGPVLACALLGSCGGTNPSGLNLFITDAPIDLAAAVNVSFSQVQLTGPSAQPQTITIDPPSSIDLYQLQGGNAAALSSFLQIAPGHYTTLSVTVATDPNTTQSNIVLPDGLHVLYVPTSVSSQVDIPIDFTLASGGTVNLTIDFDLRKSIVQDPNDTTKYLLIPAMRAVQNELSGTITGSVATALVTCATPAVYVYQGNVTPVDMDISAPAGRLQPYATALVGLNQTTGLYNFTVAYLPPGTYTVAFTCQASLDVANQADTISFPSVGLATVSAQNTTFIQLQ